MFRDGSFCYVPKGVKCPMELSTYFRINAADTGQFERTLIIADEGAYGELSRRVHRTKALDEPAPRRGGGARRARRREHQVLTVQNWYAGDNEGKGGIYNFVTKRGKCAGKRSKISWTQVETGSAITWKYPSVILQGDNSIGEFYSVAVVNNKQQADTGTKMIHIGRNTKSTIVSKGISAGAGQQQLSRQGAGAAASAENARNYTQCDSMLIGNRCGAHTFPYIEVENNTATVEHEASTSKIGEDQIFYCKQRGLTRGAGSVDDRERFLPRSVPGAPDGVRGGSAAAAWHHARRQRRLDRASARASTRIRQSLLKDNARHKSSPRRHR